MPDESSRTDPVQPASVLPPEHSGEGIPEPSAYERTIGWLASLPWWAIILGVVAVAVLYSMLTSVAYQRVIRFLTDDPQSSTTDLFSVVQIVGEPQSIIGRYVGETEDSVQTVIYNLLDDVIDHHLVTQTGFIESESPAAITVRTLDNQLITIPKDRIETEERTEDRDGVRITLTYIDRITVTGIMTDRDDDTMTIRTVNEETTTFSTDRILSRESTVIPCDTDANPGCEDREVVTIERQGEIITGTLNTLSQTNMSLALPGGNTREIRQSDVDYFHVPTLTIAINQDRADQAIAPGDEVRIAFVEGTDITAALEELNSLEDIPVPLQYADGEARAALVSYPDIDAALEATGTGEVSGLVYLASDEDRLAVADWMDDNPDSGVILPTPPRECQRGCEVTVKLVDETISGTVLEETDDEITVQTVAPEFVVLDRDSILENRRMEPGVCALNNLRGCNAGIFLTLRVTFIAYALALLIGLIIGLMRVQHNPFLYAFSTLYVEVIRGIPLLVILLYAGFVVSPWLRDNTPISLSDEWEAIIGLAFGYGAFIAEIFRAGIQSISRGQMEAARSLGMSYPQAMRYVILPQAVRVVLPPLGNDFIAMLKDSALISVLALPDLLQLGRLYVSRTFRAFEGYNTVAILYLLMTLFLSMLVRIIERRSRLPG